MENASHQITLRRLLPQELAWANAQYAQVDFVASTDKDIILIALCDGVPAGLGRIVPVGPAAGELGGMLVFDGFKGRGIARQLVAALCALPGFNVLYCLPFAELEDLYGSMGFRQVAHRPDMPEHVTRKYNWCNAHYGKPVLLMQRP